MLFNSGTTSLVSYTRDLAGDPSSAPSTLFSTQRVKDAVNECYLELYDVARQFGMGIGQKRSYADAVADQIFYEQPVDLQKIVLLEIETDGKNLSSDSTSSPTILQVAASDVALQGYEAGVYTDTSYYFVHGGHIGIVAPPDTAGSSSIRITYEAYAADLTNDTDEPEIPKTFHSLIGYRAAIVLRETMELDTRGLREIADRKEVRFMRAMHDNVADYEGSFVVAGLAPKGTITEHGKMVRS